MSLIENIINIFLVDEETEESVELKVERVESSESYETKVEEPQEEIKEVEKEKSKHEEEPKEEVKEVEKEKSLEEPKEEIKEVEEEVKENKSEEIKFKIKKVNEELERDPQRELREELKALKMELKEELKNELRKEKKEKRERKEQEKKKEKQEQDKKEEKVEKVEKVEEQKITVQKSLHLHVYNDYPELVESLKLPSLLLLTDKEKKRSIKKHLLDNNINNIFVLSSLRDFKKKITSQDIQTIIIEGEMFESNKDNITKVINIDGKIQYGIYYPLTEYKTILNSFSPLSKVQLITNQATFKRSKLREVIRRLKLSENDVIVH